MTVQSAIADKVASALPPVLAQAIYARAELGVERYGQTLDQNIQPDRAKVIHQMQELLDALNYNEWRDEAPKTTVARRRRVLAALVTALLAEYPDINLEELCHKEQHSAILDGGVTE